MYSGERQTFEQALAMYCEAPYVLAVNAGMTGLSVAARYAKTKQTSEVIVSIPSRIFGIVPIVIASAGFTVKLVKDLEWSGSYELDGLPIRVLDSTNLFARGMYISGTLMCLSFCPGKPFAIGEGGAILCDSAEAHAWMSGCASGWEASEMICSQPIDSVEFGAGSDKAAAGINKELIMPPSYGLHTMGPLVARIALKKLQNDDVPIDLPLRGSKDYPCLHESDSLARHYASYGGLPVLVSQS